LSLLLLLLHSKRLHPMELLFRCLLLQHSGLLHLVGLLF
jgi:hypothetical protein